MYVDDCMRKCLMRHFACDDDLEFDCLHDCCSNCVSACDCGSSNCQEVWGPQLSFDDEPPAISACPMERGKFTRVVTQADKQQLKQLVVKYQQDLIDRIPTEKMVSCRNVLHVQHVSHRSSN